MPAMLWLTCRGIRPTMLGYTYENIMRYLQCYGMRPTMLGYIYLNIILHFQCYGSPVGYEAYNARIHLSRYSAMPTMLWLTFRV